MSILGNPIIPRPDNIIKVVKIEKIVVNKIIDKLRDEDKVDRMVIDGLQTQLKEMDDFLALFGGQHEIEEMNREARKLAKKHKVKINELKKDMKDMKRQGMKVCKKELPKDMYQFIVKYGKYL